MALSEEANVAPYQSCVKCYRGDVTTAVATQGEAEFHVAFLVKALAIPEDEAIGTINVFAEQELGCDPGKVPGGTFTLIYRLCRDCAAKAKIKVGEISGGVPSYAQPGDR